MTGQKENVTSKYALIARTIKGTSNESKLVNKIMRQIKNNRKKPWVHLNIDEKKLQFDLNELINSWSKRKISQTINKFLEEIKLGLQRKENILLWGYFNLKVRRSVSRQVRSPRTAELIIIKEKNRLSFRASSKLKKEINKE